MSRINREYLSIAEASQYSGISKRTLWDLLKSPSHPIPHFRIGASGRIVRIRKTDFDHWVNSYRVDQNSSVEDIVNEIRKEFMS